MKNVCFLKVHTDRSSFYFSNAVFQRVVLELAPSLNDWQILCAGACTVRHITSKDVSIFSASWILWLAGFFHHCQSMSEALIFASTTLISLITVEVGINVEGGIFWKKLVHKSNRRGVEGGKI